MIQLKRKSVGRRCGSASSVEPALPPLFCSRHVSSPRSFSNILNHRIDRSLYTSAPFNHSWTDWFGHFIFTWTELICQTEYEHQGPPTDSVTPLHLDRFSRSVKTRSPKVNKLAQFNFFEFLTPIFSSHGFIWATNFHKCASHLTLDLSRLGYYSLPSFIVRPKEKQRPKLF